MLKIRFSRRSAADLLEIGAYSIERWGPGRAARYLDDLEACCKLLAEHPSLGRPCDEIRPGLHRIERGSHIIFYRENARGILISRILHKRMLPNRWRIADANAR
jgi:toxin ParE1/3/4